MVPPTNGVTKMTNIGMLRLYVKKVNRTYDVGTFESLPETSQRYLAQYGVDQSGADSHADVIHPDAKDKSGKPRDGAFKGTVAEYEAKVDADVRDWITKIQTGQLRLKSVGDPMAEVAAKYGMTVEELTAHLAKST